jgi:hypothetical protein
MANTSSDMKNSQNLNWLGGAAAVDAGARAIASAVMGSMMKERGENARELVTQGTPWIAK